MTHPPDRFYSNAYAKFLIHMFISDDLCSRNLSKIEVKKEGDETQHSEGRNRICSTPLKEPLASKRFSKRIKFTYFLKICSNIDTPFCSPTIW